MLKSLRQNRIGILLMLFSAMFVCFGQLFWKISTEKGIVFLLAGFCLYGLGALFMLVAYKFGSLSVLQPMLSISYVFTILLGWYVLKEPVTFFKIAGIILITVSVVLIGGGDD